MVKHIKIRFFFRGTTMMTNVVRIDKRLMVKIFIISMCHMSGNKFVSISKQNSRFPDRIDKLNTFWVNSKLLITGTKR